MLKWPGAHCYDDNMIVVITRHDWDLEIVYGIAFFVVHGASNAQGAFMLQVHFSVYEGYCKLHQRCDLTHVDSFS
jgi:hypothetical protein